MYKIAYISNKTKKPTYLLDIEGEIITYDTLKQAKNQLACLNNPKHQKNGFFKIL